MAAVGPQEGNVTQITLTVVDENGAARDIHGATTKEVKLRAPDGEFLTKTAQYVTDGTDGKLIFVMDEGQLRPFGTWEAQAYIECPSFTGNSRVKIFDVLSNVDS